MHCFNISQNGPMRGFKLKAAVNILKDNFPKALILNKSILDFCPKKVGPVLKKGFLHLIRFFKRCL
ncbi:MAG: hypothetical protein CM15mP98_06430 [Paracoccaceae bacterium]|nr:MAG: hypothetical protein CM15mP98_06430 [Paracoccaceae bacterium]